MTFAELGLAAPLLQTLADLGHEVPTPIQQQAIPPILAGRDLIAAAETGTGETAAFTLPLLQHLAALGTPVAPGSVRALVLVPTRELAEQVLDSVQRYAAHLPLSAYAAYGGVSLNPQQSRLAQGVDVLVATPGRLVDLFTKGAVRFRELRLLVLDEADRMLDLGFAEDLSILFSAFPRQRQTLLFSATFPEAVQGLTRSRLRDPLRVEAGPRNRAARSIEQVLIPVDKARKRELLLALYQRRGWQQLLVFANPRKGCDELAATLDCRRHRRRLHPRRPAANRAQQGAGRVQGGRGQGLGADRHRCPWPRHRRPAASGQFRPALAGRGLHPPRWPYRPRRPAGAGDFAGLRRRKRRVARHRGPAQGAAAAP